MTPYADDPEILVAAYAPRAGTPAQRVNLASIVVRGYEPVWRPRSVALLTLGRFRTEDELVRLVDGLRPRPGRTYLDAGCSAGLYARTLAHAAPEAHVHAVDLSLPFLREAGRLARRAGSRVHLLHADVERLPYRDGAFDGVASGGSLNEFRDPEAGVRELARTLAPGGRLFLMHTASAGSEPGRIVQRLLMRAGLAFPDPSDVEAWARHAGLEPVRAERYGPIALALFRKPGTPPAAGATRPPAPRGEAYGRAG